MVALIPADPYPAALAVDGGLPPEELHLTLAYLGDDVTQWDPGLGDAVIRVVQEITGAAQPDDDGPVMDNGPGTRGPLTLTVFAHSHFNPTSADGREPCMVYQFSGDGDLSMVEALASEAQYRIKDAIGEVNFPEQHAKFEPHITAGYGLDPGALSYVGPVVFDRIRVALGGDTTDILLGTGGTVTAAAPTAPDTGVAPALGAPAEIVEDTGDTIRIHWDALAVEGLDTGDGRYLTPGGGTHRGLPLSLLALPYKAHGGAEAPAAEVFGQVTHLQHRPGPDVISKLTGKPFPEGTYVWSADAVIDGTHEYADLVRKGHLRGGSIDIGDLDAELVDDETAAMSDNPRRRAIMHTYEIAAATMVPVPAFADAYCDLVTNPAGDETVLDTVAASALPVEMVTDPQPMFRAEYLGDFVARTSGGGVKQSARDKAAKTGHALDDGSFPIETADDLDNAIRQAGRAKDPAKARKHIIAQARRLKLTDRIPDNWLPNGDTKEAMTAAAVTRRPPLSWFTDPGLTEETPITITEDGHVYGHIAVWSRPHIGYGGRRIYAQPSRSDYAFFNTGAVRCLDENGTTRIAAVGHLTMNTSHADLRLPAMAAARHYDHTGTAWADVAAGDDKYGVWVNGICKPGISEEQITFAYAHPPSGDWRPIDGGLELVAALCVNTAGVPVSRARVASGEVLALVAAGALAPVERPSGTFALDDDTINRIAERVVAQQKRDTALAAQHAQLLADLDDNPTLMAQLLAELDDDRVTDLVALGLTPEQIAVFDVSTMPPQLRESYLHGKAAAKILWGTPGAFARCEAEAAHHGIPAKMRPGMCATLYKEATGRHPGKH